MQDKLSSQNLYKIKYDFDLAWNLIKMVYIFHNDSFLLTPDVTLILTTVILICINDPSRFSTEAAGALSDCHVNMAGQGSRAHPHYATFASAFSQLVP